MVTFGTTPGKLNVRVEELSDQVWNSMRREFNSSRHNQNLQLTVMIVREFQIIAWLLVTQEYFATFVKKGVGGYFTPA